MSGFEKFDPVRGWQTSVKFVEDYGWFMLIGGVVLWVLWKKWNGRVRIVDREERIKIRQTWGGYDDLTDSYTPPWEAEHEAKQEDKQDHDQQEACARRRAIPPRGPLGQPGESQENGMSEMTEEEKEAQEHALRKQSAARQKAEEAIRRRKMERETGVRRKRSPPPPSGFGGGGGYRPNIASRYPQCRPGGG